MEYRSVYCMNVFYRGAERMPYKAFIGRRPMSAFSKTIPNGGRASPDTCSRALEMNRSKLPDLSFYSEPTGANSAKSYRDFVETASSSVTRHLG